MTAKHCFIEGCGREVLAREMCNLHYSRWRNHGDPRQHVPPQTERGEPRAFADRLGLVGVGCVIWPFAKNNMGYGQINAGKGRKVLVTRYVCERANGPSPSKTHQAAHSCGNGHKGCVSPWHLSWKSPKENQADQITHGTKPRGEIVKTSKLTPDDVRQIRQEVQCKSQRIVAKRFGVSQRAVSKIVRGESWGHVR